MVKFSKKNHVKYSILALLFSFLMFGSFKDTSATSQMSVLQVVQGPVETGIQNNGNQISFWSRIGSSIMNVLSMPIRFFRWLFTDKVNHAVVEEVNSGEEIEKEEEDENENDNVRTIGNPVINGGSNLFNDLSTTIYNSVNNEEEIIEEEEEILD